jgi:phage tail sheath protein FI
VYVEEFTPGAPIQGVGTSTAAFVGTAVRGPVRTPTRVQSWDAFVATFGGFPAGGAPSWLAAGVYGFFLNGGADCYVVRAATGGPARVELPSRTPGPDRPPAMVATAATEGPGGNAVTTQVVDSSRLGAAIIRSLRTRPITAVSADRRTLSVDTAGYSGGELVTVAHGADSATAVVEGVSGGTLSLAAPVAGGVDFTGGTVTPAGALAVRRSAAAVTALSGDRATLTVDSSAGFAAGDRVLVTKGQSSAVAVVRTAAGGQLTLGGPLPAALDAAGGTVRTADLAPGQTTVRLVVPAGVTLSQALPPGSVVSVSADAPGEVAVVAASGGDTVTLADGLTGGYPMDAPADPPRLASLEFDLVVTDSATGQVETFPQLSTNPRHPAFWTGAVTSTLVSLAPAAPGPLPADARPAAGTYPLTGGVADDRAAAWADITAAPAGYLDLLTPYGEVALVAVPGAADPAVQQAVRDHCERTFNRFAVLDAAPATGTDEVLDQVAAVRSAQGFAALYYPWITVRHPVTGATESWPPSGHVLGMYALTDASRGVHKAPAGGTLRGALGVERRLADQEQGPLNLAGVNVLRVFPGQTQPVVWGARTTGGDLDRNWQYVNVRRLFVFLEQSIERGIRWAVFEPNDLGLWQRIKRTVGEFLGQVWRDGALSGATADAAYYVRVDEALNPPSSRALGRLVIEVGVAPTYPAEFLVLRIGIWQGGSQVTEQ